MKKILLRAGMSPLIDYDPTKVIIGNMFGNNIGNMLFQSGVSRTLMRGKVMIDTLHTKRAFTDKDVNMINETYSCLVLPFANAFRRGFVDELNNTTLLINKLKIPCVVIGVGAQAELGKELDAEELNEAVTNFMKAVLKKSAMVGIRGEFTADYLKKLGFQEERDFTVIGCPSLYMYGKELPEMEVKELTPDSKVSMNSKINGRPQKFHDFMYRSSQALKNHYYVPQVIEEINRVFMGRPYPKGFVKKIPNHFPADFLAPVYTSGRGVCFTNMPSWLEFLKEKDLSFGCRIHGNIAAILAGTPCIVVAADRRIKELVDYHNIPHIMMGDITEKTSIFDLYEKADFTELKRGHEERFNHYLDFLHANGLQTIFDDDVQYDIVPFDKKLGKIEFSAPTLAFSALSPEQQLKRMGEAYLEESRKNKFYKDAYETRPVGKKERLKYVITGGREDRNTSYYPLIREYETDKEQEKKKKRKRENDAEGL